MRNDGQISWPCDAVFQQTSGDNLMSKAVMCKYEVKPETNYTWEMELTAPNKSGRYTAYFRVITNDGKKFGHKVWCDIQVIEALPQV